MLRLLIYASIAMMVPVTAGANTQIAPSVGNDLVVLLHGLARSNSSMNTMRAAFADKGYRTCNIDYPSTHFSIATLAHYHVLNQLRACTRAETRKVHFVTHSMGGIIARYLIKHRLVEDLGRVVMLSPPNKGSEVVDVLGETWLFEFINGPAGNQLGTEGEDMPAQLGPANFELGIITGNRSINWILSLLIEGSDDGKVSIENAKLEGMIDFIVLPATHTFIMRDDDAIEQSLHFIEHGVFNREAQ
jgi:pimeloyl-ACP methyl ester carboxylesterase